MLPRTASAAGTCGWIHMRDVQPNAELVDVGAWAHRRARKRPVIKPHEHVTRIQAAQVARHARLTRPGRATYRSAVL